MKSSPVKTAVIIGGHPYDVVNFNLLFRSLEGIDAYIQHMDDFASSPEEVRDSYETVLFYTMLMDGPSDEGIPGYAGKPLTAIEHFGETQQGIFLLHHAILAYPQYAKWNDLVGIGDREFGYHVGQSIHVDVLDSSHPITEGMGPWDMTDETYTMADASDDSHFLLGVEHPKSMKKIAWARRHGKSRVFCFQSGHDDETWRNESFREVLRRGILWCANRI